MRASCIAWDVRIHPCPKPAYTAAAYRTGTTLSVRESSLATTYPPTSLASPRCAATVWSELRTEKQAGTLDLDLGEVGLSKQQRELAIHPERAQ